MTTFAGLFEQHAAASIDRQLVLSNLLGARDWWLDLDAGTISFGEPFTFSVQILGTESEISNTWRWAWSQPEEQMPATVVQAANTLREFGEQHQIPELAEWQFELGALTGHDIAIVATGVFGGGCYYRCSYERGAAYVMLDMPLVRRQMDSSPSNITRIFNAVISSYDVNHRRALVAYLSYKGYTVEEMPDCIMATGSDGTLLRATFDGEERLIDFSFPRAESR